MPWIGWLSTALDYSHQSICRFKSQTLCSTPFMSKIVKKIDVRQFSEYLAANGLLPKSQSGFRKHHSTESALLRIFSDLYTLFSGRWTDLIACTARCEFRLRHGRSLHPTRRVVHLVWAHGISIRLDAIVHRRSQTVHYSDCESVSCFAVVSSGVAQGLVFGPLLYVLYTADIQKLVVSIGFGVHLYTDDTQSTAPVNLRMLLIWLPEPSTSSA